MADAGNAGTNLRVSRGDPQRLPAAWVNETSQRNADVRKLQALLQGQGKHGFVASPQIKVRVQNDSDGDRNAGEILGITGIVLDPPTTNPTDPQTSNFYNGPILDGETPLIANDDFGFFVVCLEPIAKGAVGTACIGGLCAAYVNMISADDDFADITNNDATQLTSGCYGGAQIFYSPGTTGKQQCLVRLGNVADRGVGVVFGNPLTQPGWYNGTIQIPNQTSISGSPGIGGACAIFNAPDQNISPWPVTGGGPVPSGQPWPGIIMGKTASTDTPANVPIVWCGAVGDFDCATSGGS